MSYAAENDFRVGDVLSRSLAVLLSNFLPFIAICLILSLPGYLYALFGNQNVDPQNIEVSLGIIAMAIATVLLAFVATAALVYGALQELRGQHAGVGECIGRGLSLMFPVLGVAIVSGIGVGLGLLALIIPGVILGIMWWVAVPAAVVERPGVFGALGRSAELTKGYRWRIFGLLVLIVIIQFLLAMVLGLIISVVGSPATALFVQWLADAFITAFYAVVTAVGYHDLRVAKEGFDVNQIAAVFD